MKQFFLFIFLLIGLVSTTTAQSQVKYLTNSGDTVTNTTAVIQEIEIPNAQSSVSIELANTKISGTVGGKVYFEASNVGNYWVPLDSITNGNRTLNGASFEVAPALHKKYRVRHVGASSMSYKTDAVALIRK